MTEKEIHEKGFVTKKDLAEIEGARVKLSAQDLALNDECSIWAEKILDELRTLKHRKSRVFSDEELGKWLVELAQKEQTLRKSILNKLSIYNPNPFYRTDDTLNCITEEYLAYSGIDNVEQLQKNNARIIREVKEIQPYFELWQTLLDFISKIKELIR